jgi:hypothetical protein
MHQDRSWRPATRWTRAAVVLSAAVALAFAGMLSSGPPAHASIPCLSTNFSIGLDSTDRTLTPGGRISVGVHLIANAPFSCRVRLSVDDLPNGVTAAVPTSLLSGSSAVGHVELATSATMPLGRFPITIVATNPENPITRPPAIFQLIVAAQTAPGANGSNSEFSMLAHNTTGSAIIGGGGGYAEPRFSLKRHPTFNGTVRMTANDLPVGVTATVLGGTTTHSVKLTPSASSPTGTFRVTLTAVSVPVRGAPAPPVTLHYWLTIVAAPGFSLSLFTPAGTAPRGGSTSTVVRQTVQAAAAEYADLTVSGLPAGVTAFFSSTQVSSTAPSTLAFTTSQTSPVGTFLVIVTGTSVATGLAATATFRLTIVPAPTESGNLSTVDGT